MVIVLLLFLASCASQQVITTKPVKVAVKKVHSADMIKVTLLTNFTGKEKVKASKYIQKMNEVVSSKCFMDFIKERKMHSTEGLTNTEVVRDLRSSQAEIELIMYYKRFSRVAGYTKPGSTWIKLNRKYHSGASLCSEGSNLAHELSHKFGYGHSYKANKARPYSVPHSVNEAFKVCCE